MMKAVFFDLDGTLIDSDPYWVRSQETLVRSCGGEWSDALADALQGGGFPRDRASAARCGGRLGWRCNRAAPVR